MFDNRRRWIFTEIVIPLQILSWPIWPLTKSTAAIGADIVQVRLDAVPAEGAFIGTDHGVGRVGRQVLVAIFAVRPQLQH